MIRRAVADFAARPRIPPPPRRRGSWLFVALVVLAAVVEAAVADVVWPVVSVATFVVIAPALWFRSRYPGPATVAVAATTIAIDLVAMAVGVSWQGLSAMVVVLLLPASAFRWGSGREAITALGAMFLAGTVASLDGSATVADTIGGYVVLTLAAAVGLAVRFSDEADTNRQQQVRAEERERLARELHDTVAHHVSAIAVQAQVGRTLAGQRPEAPLEALAVIEEAASRTLDEMRSMVRSLRTGDEEVELAPGRSLRDLPELAAAAGALRLELDVEGDTDGLRPSVEAALFRLAQESVTNAARHARGAGVVTVRVVVDDEQAQLVVTDDGETASPPGEGRGFGLVGMRERVELLGGRFRAGPAGRGWRVEAELPLVQVAP